MAKFAIVQRFDLDGFPTMVAASTERGSAEVFLREANTVAEFAAALRTAADDLEDAFTKGWITPPGCFRKD